MATQQLYLHTRDLRPTPITWGKAAGDPAVVQHDAACTWDVCCDCCECCTNCSLV
jgi:hypothetical protein